MGHSEGFGRLKIKLSSQIEFCTCGAIMTDVGCTGISCVKSRHMLREPLVLGMHMNAIRQLANEGDEL